MLTWLNNCQLSPHAPPPSTASLARSLRAATRPTAPFLPPHLPPDGSGEISYHEYLRYALRDALARSSTKVMDLFQAMDTDGEGDVDVDEFRRGLASLGFDIPYEAAGEVFAEMDADGSGKISFDELHKQLRVGANIELKKRLQVGGAGEVRTSQHDKQQKYQLRGTREEQYMRELNAASAEREELRRQRKASPPRSPSPTSMSEGSLRGGGSNNKPSGPPPEHLMQLMGAAGPGRGGGLPPRSGTAPTRLPPGGLQGLGLDDERPATAGLLYTTTASSSLSGATHAGTVGFAASGDGGGGTAPPPPRAPSPLTTSAASDVRGAGAPGEPRTSRALPPAVPPAASSAPGGDAAGRGRGPPPRPATSPPSLMRGGRGPGGVGARTGLRLNRSHQNRSLTYEEKAAAARLGGAPLAYGSADDQASLGWGGTGGSWAVGSTAWADGDFYPSLKLTSAASAVSQASMGLPGGATLRASPTAQPGGGGTVALPDQVQRAAVMRRGGMPISSGKFVIADERKSKTIQEEKRDAAARRNQDFALEQHGRQLSRAPDRPVDPRHHPEMAAHYEAKKLGGTHGGSDYAAGVLGAASGNRYPQLHRPYSKGRPSNARAPSTLVARGEGPPGFTLGFSSQHTSSFLGGTVPGLEADDFLVFPRKTQPGVFYTHKWEEPLPDTTPRGTQMLMMATGRPQRPNYAVARTQAYPHRYNSPQRPGRY